LRTLHDPAYSSARRIGQVSIDLSADDVLFRGVSVMRRQLLNLKRLAEGGS
jgi:hypothetical protein